jgi:hypothetical protein
MNRHEQCRTGKLSEQEEAVMLGEEVFVHMKKGIDFVEQLRAEGAEPH